MPEALEALSAEELREVILHVMPMLHGRSHELLAKELIDRASCSEADRAPAGPTQAYLKEILDFVEAARRVGFADPEDVGRLRDLVLELPRGPRSANHVVRASCGLQDRYPPQHFLYFLPLPQGQGSLRPTRTLRTGAAGRVSIS